jgi:Asp-tRNA(Asn)/Glu-tRNA(Gln) amidotransferase A subunit family amidase
MVPVAFGTQTAGSVIRPAAFCGVVGYKPSFGLISRSGMLPFAESLDTVGTFARTVADAALLASVASGRPAPAAVEPGPAPRVGLWRTAHWEQASTEAKAAVMAAASRLARAGGGGGVGWSRPSCRPGLPTCPRPTPR